MLCIIFLIIILQIFNTSQQNYDDDINIAYPSEIIYQTYSRDQVRYLDPIENCSCKELAGIDIHCYGKKCFKFPRLSNLNLQLFKLKLTSIAAIQLHDFDTMTKLKYLEINANVKLIRIEPGSFRNLTNLKNLTLISNTNLKYLDENVFEGLINIEQMVFQKNGFTKVLDITNSLSVKFVPKLTFLDLGESMFYQILEHEFYPMTGIALNQLNLILCELEYIHKDTLKPLKNVTTLRLGQNVFNLTSLTEFILRCAEYKIPLNYLNLYNIGMRKTVPKNLMEAIAATTITNLCLPFNHFDVITDSSFPYNPNIIELDLRNNYIVEISDNAFKNLPNLKRLHLGENKLISVPQAVLLPQIVYLDLAGNTFDGAFFNIQEDVFLNMSNLKNLQLSYNYLNSIQRSSLPGLVNLKKLNLKSTSLQHIEEKAFKSLKSLELLNLMNNQFAPLTAEIFNGLNHLQVLLLGGCAIRNLSQTPNIFTNVPNLTYLGLEKTEIHTISQNQFTHLHLLQTLNLAENKLAAWSKTILPHGTLKCLYAQQNKISSITIAMLQDWQYLESLSLEGNPIPCDCSLCPIVSWIENNNISLIYERNKYFVGQCIYPEKWRQKSIATFLKNLTYVSYECEIKIFNSNEVVMWSILALIILIILSLMFVCFYKKPYHNLCADKIYHI